MKKIIVVQLAVLFLVFSCKNETNTDIQQVLEKDSVTKELSFYAVPNNKEIFILNDKAVKLLVESRSIYKHNQDIKDQLFE